MGVFKPFKELYAFGCESPDEICPLYLARFTNFIFGTANFFLIYLIQSNLNSKYLVSIWSPNFGRPFLKVQKDFNRLYRFSTDILNILHHTQPVSSISNLSFSLFLSLSLFQYADKFKVLVSSLATASLPPLFFFNFLYYTDPGSLFFVLLMYLFDLEDHTYLAALFGFLSLLFRQTNIVWVFFVAAKYSVTVSFSLL